MHPHLKHLEIMHRSARFGCVTAAVAVAPQQRSDAATLLLWLLFAIHPFARRRVDGILRAAKRRMRAVILRAASQIGIVAVRGEDVVVSVVGKRHDAVSPLPPLFAVLDAVIVEIRPAGLPLRCVHRSPASQRPVAA